MNAADVAVVGAGAAGLMTAIAAARHDPGRTIVAVDAAPRLGAKILVSGGGRCNVTNRVVTPDDFFGGNPHLIRRVLGAFPAERTVRFFHDLGVPLHEEEDGKLFPDSGRARDVVAALVGTAEHCGVQILSRRRVVAVQREGAFFTLTTESPCGPTVLRARTLVLATGGLSLPKTGSDGAGHRFAQQLGHTLVPTTPALDPLVLEGDLHAGLAGISQPVELTVDVERARPTRLTGCLLWTHFGISGPVVLNASRFWHRARVEGRAVRVTANFLPGWDFATAEQRLIQWAADHPTAHLSTALGAWLPARVGEALLRRLRISRETSLAQLRREDRRALVHGLLECRLPVVGGRGYNYAEVTAGGVPLGEIDPATMGSRVCPGLHLVGELLDVDGRIGGFNFQWAWSSGWVAGNALG